MLRVAMFSATSALAAGAAADPPAPSLPPGYVAASGALGKPTVRKAGHSSLQSAHEFTFSTRSALPGTRAEIAGLPVLEVAPSDLVEEPAPRALPAGGPGDLVVLKAGGGARLSIQGFEAGILRLGKANPVATGRQSGGGVAKACGAEATGSGVTPLSYEALRRADDHGGLELVMARGAFDTSSCKIAITGRLSTRPAHLAGGIVYAFKTHCAGCEEGARDVLHVVTPQGQKGKFDFFVPFEHHRLRLVRGTSAAFSASTGAQMTSFNTWNLPDWGGLVKRQCAVDDAFCFTDVRFEVSWAMGEPSPTAFLAGEFLAPAVRPR